MKKHRILRKDLFEKLEVFEDRVNNTHGYEAVSISNEGAVVLVLMKKVS